MQYVYLVLNFRVVAKLQQEKKGPVMSSEVWNNKRIKGILTQLHQYSAKKCISHSDLMVESPSSENKNIYIHFLINALQLNELSALRNMFYPEYKYLYTFFHIFSCKCTCTHLRMFIYGCYAPELLC